MLFAVDIDYTIATIQGTDAVGAYLRAEGIPLSDEWHMNEYEHLLTLDALLHDTLFASWYQKQDPASFLHLLYEGQYHPATQEQAIPIEGAAETLSRLKEAGHHVMYVTNRKPSTWEVTRHWLARYEFPNPERLFCCGGEGRGFEAKVQSALSELRAREQVIFIDDLSKYYEKTIAFFVKRDRSFVSQYVRRLAVIGFGSDLAPPCPYSYPAFPLVPMPDWKRLDETLAIVLPYIGGDCRKFFEPDFEPSLLRRIPVPPRNLVPTSA